MAVPLETLLENLEEVLEEGMGVPLSGGKRMVDVDAARDIIDDIRANMPSEILQAKAIVHDRASIIAKAKKEAEEQAKREAEEAAKAAQEAAVAEEPAPAEEAPAAEAPAEA